MRKILFRAKTEKGKWVYGDLVHRKSGATYINNSEDRLFLVDLRTVGQYIGLKDKEKTKIFEGDFVEDTFGHSHGGWTYLKFPYGKVVFKKAKFNIKQLKSGSMKSGKQTVNVNMSFKELNSNIGNFNWESDCHKHLRVIGNTHDNKELRKGIQRY
jgi:uncharacterized phage protein (TIGR01671 family)